MIVCHCNVLTKEMINEAIESLIDDDPYRLITPGVVYRELGKRGKCCGCFPQVVSLIVARLEEFQTSNPAYVLERIIAGSATASLSAGGIRLALRPE
ncbi:MAG: bacterioferritin-associated ferredoxin [Devosiaceae bacterium]